MAFQAVWMSVAGRQGFEHAAVQETAVTHEAR